MPQSRPGNEWTPRSPLSLGRCSIFYVVFSGFARLRAMKVILFMAMSANGMVARSNGEEDFISDENWEAFCDLARKYRGLLVGRKAYQAVKSWGGDYSWGVLNNVKKIVLSTDSDFTAGEGFLTARSVDEAFDFLNSSGISEVLLGGGPTVNSEFMSKNLINEIIFHIEPALIGEGRSVFSSRDFESRLELIDYGQRPGGIFMLHYRVK